MPINYSKFKKFKIWTMINKTVLNFILSTNIKLNKKTSVKCTALLPRNKNGTFLCLEEMTELRDI